MNKQYIETTKCMVRIGFMGVVTIFMMSHSSCTVDDPKKEDTPEMITSATLMFIPSNGTTPVTATATDPDGEGIQNLTADVPINLVANSSYTLQIKMINELAPPGSEEYYISDEVEEEGDEHIFYYGWTNGVFADPEGNGNIDNRTDVVNYEDLDKNSLPLGLSTLWTTGSVTSGTFRVLLKHQPGLKTSISGSTEGETDLDVTFSISVQ